MLAALLRGGNNWARPKTSHGAVSPIFSGRMDFPPNYQSALWFIDRVLPRVTAKEPAVELVIAGPNPVPGLRARSGANVRVTGYTDDLGADIAASQLYVAPMVSGSGFKNKVIAYRTEGCRPCKANECEFSVGVVPRNA